MEEFTDIPDTALAAQLRSQLQMGLLSSAQLQSASGKSQASVSRALASLGADVVPLGKAQHTRYGLLRDIQGSQPATHFYHPDRRQHPALGHIALAVRPMAAR